MASALFLLLPFAGQAGAQAGGCGSRTGLATADVTIEEPSHNGVVSGRNVVVRGEAQANIGQLRRVEITIAGLSQVRESAPTTSLSFDASFDLSNVAPGEATVRVVACGPSTLAGALTWGDQEISVRVQAPPPTTTTSAPTATTLRSSVGVQSALSQGATPASVAVSTTKPGQAASGTSTTATSGPPPTEAPVVEIKPEPIRPKAGTDAPLVLTESPDSGSPRPPLWVGAVVGASGGLGLLFSASSARRRNRVPERAEPLAPSDETDLVDVR